MIQTSNRLAAAAFAMVLCAASTPANGGTISIEPAPDDAGGRNTAPHVAEGVGDSLGAHGFTILDDPGHSAMIAEISFTRTDVGTGSAKVSTGRATVAPNILGAAGGGVTVPLSAPHTRSVPLQRIRLELRIRRRADGAPVWSGAAVTVRTAGGRNTDEAVAASLCEAILRGYPNEPAGVLSVP